MAERRGREGIGLTSSSIRDSAQRVRTEIEMAIDEQPELMRHFMHKRMALKSQVSLCKSPYTDAAMQEVTKHKVRKLREIHHELLGIKNTLKRPGFSKIETSEPRQAATLQS